MNAAGPDLACHCTAGLGRSPQGVARHGSPIPGRVWQVTACRGGSGLSFPGRGEAPLGLARRGMARLDAAGHVLSRLGPARHGLVWRGSPLRLGTAWFGPACLGLAGLGKSRRGSASHGTAWHGLSWQVAAGQDWSRPGVASLGMTVRVSAGPGGTGLVKSGLGTARRHEASL